MECSRLLAEDEEGLFGAGGRGAPGRDAEALAKDYGELEAGLLQTLELSLGEHLAAPVLVSATEAVLLEEERDQRWRRGPEAPPPWRPRDWRRLHDEALRDLVARRLDSPTEPSDSPTKMSSFQEDIAAMARQLKADLVAVAAAGGAGGGTCQLYAALYHQAFAARLRKLADFGLGDKDCASLLQWVNVYYPG